MKAFVAGATGYTGRHVVTELLRRNVEVVAHVRPDSRSLERWRDHFSRLGARVDTTPWSAADMTATFQREQPTHVFALLGTTRSRARKERALGGNDSYETVDYGLTATLLNATLSTNHKTRFIYLSAIGVRPGTRNPYLEVRARLEAELKGSGLCYIIARPALITGEDREEFRFTERAAAVAVSVFLSTAWFIGLKKFRDRFATLSGPQLARALVAAGLSHDCDVVLEVPQLLELAAS